MLNERKSNTQALVAFQILERPHHVGRNRPGDGPQCLQVLVYLETPLLQRPAIVPCSEFAAVFRAHVVIDVHGAIVPLPSRPLAATPRSDTRPRIHSRCVTVLCSVGFRPYLISSANSTISHAAEKMASSPCSCQNSMSNSRSGKLPSTRRVFHFGWESAFSSIILFLRPDAQRLHLPVQIAPLQP